MEFLWKGVENDNDKSAIYDEKPMETGNDGKVNVKWVQKTRSGEKLMIFKG